MLVAAVAAGALAAFTPVVVHDGAERFPLASAAAHAPIARSADARPAGYGHAVGARDGGTWLQYWLYYPYQDQDRGIVRTGRHVADWELVQFRIDAAGQPLEAVYAQHSGAERCSWGEVEQRGGRPVVYAAHGSHASYLHAGTRDRLWPDPNDEADGRGPVVAPRLVEISAGDPRWMTYPDPWGPSRANRLVPPEQDSPRGPAFQPDRWDPNRIAASARHCRATCNTVGECDTTEKAITAGAIALPALASIAFWRRRRRSGPTSSRASS